MRTLSAARGPGTVQRQEHICGHLPASGSRTIFHTSGKKPDSRFHCSVQSGCPLSPKLKSLPPAQICLGPQIHLPLKTSHTGEPDLTAQPPSSRSARKQRPRGPPWPHLPPHGSQPPGCRLPRLPNAGTPSWWVMVGRSAGLQAQPSGRSLPGPAALKSHRLTGPRGPCTWPSPPSEHAPQPALPDSPLFRLTHSPPDASPGAPPSYDTTW